MSIPTPHIDLETTLVGIQRIQRIHPPKLPLRLRAILLLEMFPRLRLHRARRTPIDDIVVLPIALRRARLVQDQLLLKRRLTHQVHKMENVLIAIEIEPDNLKLKLPSRRPMGQPRRPSPRRIRKSANPHENPAVAAHDNSGLPSLRTPRALKLQPARPT